MGHLREDNASCRIQPSLSVSSSFVGSHVKVTVQLAAVTMGGGALLRYLLASVDMEI